MTTKARLGWMFGIGLGTLLPMGASTLFTMDTTRSRVSLTLSLQGKEDTEESPLSGFLQVAWQPGTSPQDVQLQDYRISTTRGLTFLLNYGILGRIDANLDSLTLTPPGLVPEPVNGRFDASQVLFTNFMSYARGGGQYVATGVPCTVLKSFGRACTDTFDFDDEPPRLVPEVAGTLQQVGDVYELVLVYPVEQSLDPQAPDLGSLAGQAVIVATAEVTPSLAVTSAGQGLVLRWPKRFSSYKVQVTDGLTVNPGWRDLGSAAVEDGEFLSVTVPTGGGQAFYRLLKVVAP